MSNTVLVRTTEYFVGFLFIFVLFLVAPVVQLVTSKPSDVGTCVRISAQSHELGFFLKKS